MEYKILEIPESSSTDEIDRALKRIRAKYHPNRNNSSEAGQRLVQLAEEARRSLLIRRMASSALEPAASRVDILRKMPINPFEANQPMFDIIRNMPLNESVNTPGRRVHESSYSYSNINGNVNETGRINGRSMTQSELNQCRPRNRRFYISDTS